MARKATNKVNKEFNLTNAIKSTTKTVNTFVIETSENVIDEVIEGGMKWQEVSEKAIKGGLKLAEIQQDVIFKALESIKSSVKKGGKRFNEVLSSN